MRVLVACEYSGRVRDAFIARGHDAMSCDLLPTEVDGPHHQGDVLDIINDCWDLMVAHPPCTHLAVSGARWFKDKQKKQAEALEFVRLLLNAPIDRIALENPVSIISSRIRKPDQTIQPWQFGHGEVKRTCLWLKNLPLLTPTNIVEGRERREYIRCRLGRIAGRSAAAPIKASLMLWLTSGSISDDRQNPSRAREGQRRWRYDARPDYAPQGEDR